MKMSCHSASTIERFNASGYACTSERSASRFSLVLDLRSMLDGEIKKKERRDKYSLLTLHTVSKWK